MLLTATLLCCCGEGRQRRIRIGVNPWPGYQPLALAAQKGFFAAHDIEAQVVEFESLHDMVTAFERQQIDVMPGTLAEVLAVHEGGRRVPEVIFVADASEGADVVLARGEVRSPSELRGERIAYEPGALGSYMLSRLLDAGGLTIVDVVPVGMHQEHMAAGIEHQRVDVAITYPPTTAKVAALAGMRQIFTTAQIPDEVLDVVAVDRGLLDSDPEFLPNFYAALGDTLAFTARDPAAAREIMAKACGITAEEWVSAIQGIRFHGLEDQAELLWQSDRIRTVAQRLDAVLRGMSGPRRPLPESLTVGHRKMPDCLSLPSTPR